MEAQNAWTSQAAFPSLVDTLKESGVRPPLYFALLKMWGLVSWQETWLRLLSLILSTGAVIVVYKMASALFCRGTGTVAAALCAASPLLAASAGSLVAPYGLDVLLYALILPAFLRLLIVRDRNAWIAHTLLLAAGAYANPALLTLVVAEGLFLAVYFRRKWFLWRKWAGSAAVALLLFLPWFPVSVAQVQRPFGHDDLITKSTGLRMSGLLTELSLGRLYAWYPLTPVISLMPPSVEDEKLSLRRPDPGDEDALAGWLQAVQMVSMGIIAMLAMVGVCAAMKLSAWPVPVYLKLRRLRASIGGKSVPEAEGAECEARHLLESPRQGAALLLCFLVVPVLLMLGAAILMGWPFEGSELVFLALPLLILAARGFGAFEWRPMYYTASGLFLGLCVFFALTSRGIDGLTDGTEAAALAIEAEFDHDGGDAILHENPMTYFPVLFYSGGRLDASTFIAGPEGPGAWGGASYKDAACIRDLEALSRFNRVWWIGIVPQEDTVYANTMGYLEALGHEKPEEEETTSFEPLTFVPLRDWTKLKEVRFNNILLTLYGLQE